MTKFTTAVFTDTVRWTDLVLDRFICMLLSLGQY